MTLKSVFAPIALAATIAACGVAAQDEGEVLPAEEIGSVSSAIINGITPAANDALANITVHLGLGRSCSGTLISNRWVLTAGHCITGGAQAINVYLRDNTTFVTSDYGIRHPEFVANQNVHNVVDAGLLHLTAPLGPANLQTLLSPVVNQAGSVLNCYGYGDTAATELPGPPPAYSGSGAGALLRAPIQVRLDTSNRIYEMQRWDGTRIQAVGDSGGACFDGSGRVVGIQSTVWFQGGALAQSFQAKASYVRTWVNGNVFFQQEKELTTLNTTPGQMTLFRQDGAGHVWFRNFTSGAPGTPTNWNGWVRIGDDWNTFPPQKIAAASRNTAHQDIFLRGYDNKIWTTYRDNLGAWMPWFMVNASLPDTFVSDVSAVAKNEVVTIAAIKSDNVLYTNYWSLAGNSFDKWYQWRQLSGATFPTSKRVALVQPSGSDIQAFGIRTSDGLMVTAKRTGVATWAGWTTVQNNAQFPAQNVAAGIQGTNVHVFAQKSDNRLYYNLQTGSSWAGFFAIGSPSNAFPLDNEIAVGQRTSNQLDVFMRGYDGRLYSTYSNSAHLWAGWGVMGDSWNTTPNGGGIALASRNANQLQFFTVGFDNNVWTSNWESGVTNWTTWASMGDPPTN